MWKIAHNARGNAEHFDSLWVYSNIINTLALLWFITVITISYNGKLPSMLSVVKQACNHVEPTVEKLQRVEKLNAGSVPG